MASLHLDLADDVKARLQARASESGYPSVEQFACAVLEAHAEQNLVDDDIEALLAERTADPQPEIPFTDQFKQQFRQQVARRRAQRS